MRRLTSHQVFRKLKHPNWLQKQRKYTSHNSKLFSENLNNKLYLLHIKQRSSLKTCKVITLVKQCVDGQISVTYEQQVTSSIDHLRANYIIQAIPQLADSVLLSVVLVVTMKATLLLWFALLSCVSLLVGAKSIKSKHGKISFVTAGVKRICLRIIRVCLC